MNKTQFLSFAALVAALSLASCVPDMKEQYARGTGLEKDSAMPEAPEGDRVSHLLSTEESSLRKIITGQDHEFTQADEVYLRSAFYEPVRKEDGSLSLDLPDLEGQYKMFCLPEGSTYWYVDGAEYPMKDLVIPYSQFYKSTADSLRFYPLYAEAGSAGDGSIVFKEVISAVGVIVKGDAKIASIHLRNKAAEQVVTNNMAGVASYDPQDGFRLQEGVNFVNLNCTEGGNGVPINSEGTVFYLLLAPGNYAEGLTLTVTDMSHKGQVFDIPAFEVNTGEVKVFDPVTYAPDGDLLFFEHFDNFVWGGNVQGNRAVSAYGPDNQTSPDVMRLGTEEAFVKLGNNTPGSAMIQSNWAAAKGWTVGERPSVSASYVKSRNIGDVRYMFRCSEYQGCLQVGAETSRGGFQPFKTLATPAGEVFYGLRISYDICLAYGTDELFGTDVTYNGIVSSLSVDGTPVELEGTVDGNNTYSYNFHNICNIGRKILTPPSSDRYQEGWHHVEMTIDNLSHLSEVCLWGTEGGVSMRHGVFIDNVEVRYIKKDQRPEGCLRVMLYNIQEGMWADQANNFDNFVEFVKKYDPDVCVFCEASSKWKDGEAGDNAMASTSSYRLFKNRAGYTPNQSGIVTSELVNDQWKALAKRFGHNYSAVGAYKDGYPQVITSKLPITTKARIFSGKDINGTNLSLTHGAGHFQVTYAGETVNIISLHLYPFKAWPNGADNLRGYNLQRREVHVILSQTITRDDCGDNWLVMGDTNSISPIDEEYYDNLGYTRYANEGLDWVKAHTPDNGGFRDGTTYGRQLYDMLREGEGSYYKGPGRFMTSTGGQVRYDMMYGSESMRRRVTSYALTINDGFSHITSSAVYDPDSDTKHAKVPSDHLPVLIDFDMSK